MKTGTLQQELCGEESTIVCMDGDLIEVYNGLRKTNGMTFGEHRGPAGAGCLLEIIDGKWVIVAVEHQSVEIV